MEIDKIIKTMIISTFLITGLFAIMLIGFTMIVSSPSSTQNCIYDNKKVIDMQAEDFLVIKFQDCSDCEHYWLCDSGNETWFFEKDYALPEHFSVGDYVQIKRCQINNTGFYYSRDIKKINY